MAEQVLARVELNTFGNIDKIIDEFGESARRLIGKGRNLILGAVS